MRWLRIVGILMILASPIFYQQFRNQMAVVAEAKEEASRLSVRSSADRRADQQREAALSREAAHRLLARNWSLSGIALVVVGSGLLGVPWLLARRRQVAPPTGKPG